MRYNIKTEVKDYEGNLIPAAEGTNLNYRDVINAALNNTAPGEVMTPEDKGKIYQISSKIWDSKTSKDVNLSSDEVVFIKGRAGLTLPGPLHYGRLVDFLEGEAQPEAPEK